MRNLKKQIMSWILPSTSKGNTDSKKNDSPFLSLRKEHFFDTIKIVIIYSHISFGFSIIKYSSQIKVNTYCLIQDIGVIGYELNSLLFFVYIILFHTSILSPLILIEITRNFWNDLKGKISKTIISLITCFLFVFLFYFNYINIIRIHHNSLIYCLLEPAVIYTLYIIFIKKRSFYILFLSSFIILLPLSDVSLSHDLLKTYGIVPPAQSEYLFKGTEDTSTAITEAVTIADLKQKETPFYKDKRKYYRNNPDVLHAVMTAGDYVYFLDYDLFIRVKKDDVIFLGTKKELETPKALPKGGQHPSPATPLRNIP